MLILVLSFLTNTIEINEDGQPVELCGGNIEHYELNYTSDKLIIDVVCADKVFKGGFDVIEQNNR